MEEQSDLLFGRIAVLSGFCSQEEVSRCVDEQRELRETGGDDILGAVMVRHGVLTFEQVNAVLRTQHFTQLQRMDRVFGRLAVRNRIVTEEDVRNCLARQDRLFQDGVPVPRIGEMLVQEGRMTTQEMEAILAAQERLDGGDSSA